MTQPEVNSFTKGSYTEHLELLRSAVSWFEIASGRPPRYEQLVREFFEEEKRSREHILAYNESCEITDIHRLWQLHIDRFSQLKQKIKQCLENGPILREDENPSRSTNRWRNDSFVYLLAGELISASVNVIAVDGIVRDGETCHKDGDISFKWSGQIFDIQCKRPQNVDRLEERVKAARDQIKKSGRAEQCGFIAIDCSALMPREKLLESDSPEHSMKLLYRIFDSQFTPVVEKCLDHSIRAILLYARVAAMTRAPISPVLSPARTPYVYTRPDTIKSLSMVVNPSRSDIDVSYFVYQRMTSRINGVGRSRPR